MPAAPLSTRPLPSLHQEIILGDQQIHDIEKRLLRILRPTAWDFQVNNTLKGVVCLDMAMDLMMAAIALYDRRLALERGHGGKRITGAFVSAIGVPDFEVDEHQTQIILCFRQQIHNDLKNAPTDRLQWSQDFGFRLSSLYKVGAEIPMELGKHWLSLNTDDSKLLLSWTQRNCAPVLSWKRMDKGEERMTARENIDERFLSAQRLKDLSKRV